MIQNQLWQERVQRAQESANRLRAVPFIRLVGLNGSLLTGRMKESSDIDFYVVAAVNRLFTVRTLVTLSIHLSGWRRYGRKIRGRICLNRFATTQALQITPHNDYHARVFSKLAPLVSINKTYEKFLKSNKWMAGFPYKVVIYQPQIRRKSLLSFIRFAGEYLFGGRIGDWLESGLKKWQVKRIQADPRTREPGSRVYLREHELCFHNNK